MIKNHEKSLCKVNTIDHFAETLLKTYKLTELWENHSTLALIVWARLTSGTALHTMSNKSYLRVKNPTHIWLIIFYKKARYLWYVKSRIHQEISIKLSLGCSHSEAQCNLQNKMTWEALVSILLKISFKMS